MKPLTGWRGSRIERNYCRERSVREEEYGASYYEKISVPLVAPGVDMNRQSVAQPDRGGE